jgi:hypothetical protein
MALVLPTTRSPHARGPRREVVAATVSLLLSAGGCGPTTPDPASPSASAQPTAAATADAAPATTGAPATAPAPAASAPAAAAPKPGVPFDSVPPPGTNPLSDAEAKELSSKCKKFTDVVTAAAKKAGSGKRPIDGLFEALANPPKVAGVDVARCSELMRRETIDFFARTRESEAKINLRRVIVGFMSALDGASPAFCGSAPAVPPALENVKDQPYASKPEDWKADGWKCVRFDLSGAPQVFQYELRTDPKGKTYEVIARGYPVQGGPATELYIAGKVESGAIDPSTPIMRR